MTLSFWEVWRLKEKKDQGWAESKRTDGPCWCLPETWAGRNAKLFLLSFSTKQRTCTQELSVGWTDGILRERGWQSLPSKRLASELCFFWNQSLVSTLHLGGQKKKHIMRRVYSESRSISHSLSCPPSITSDLQDAVVEYLLIDKVLKFMHAALIWYSPKVGSQANSINNSYVNF